ncbi:MAG: hypothetical protein IJN50_06915 [Clostridia bacterium]|nr:hypothetical protein [Clostridia bacterium]
MKSISIKMLKIMLLLVIGICLLSVVSKVNAIQLSRTSITINVGESYTITATDNGEKVKGVKAQATGTGKVDIYNKDGNVTITGRKAGTQYVTITSLTNLSKMDVCTVHIVGDSEDTESDGIEVGSNSEEIDIAGTINVVAEIVSIIFNLIKTFILPLLTSLTM